MRSDLYDITIIGGGPVGLFGAFYAGLRGMRVKSSTACPNWAGNSLRCTLKSMCTTCQASLKCWRKTSRRR